MLTTQDEGFKNKGFKNKSCITDKNVKYFTYQCNNACNLGKLYRLPKFHKGLSEVPGRPVKKLSEFLNSHLKSITQEGVSYIKDTTDLK